MWLNSEFMKKKKGKKKDYFGSGSTGMKVKGTAAALPCSSCCRTSLAFAGSVFGCRMHLLNVLTQVLQCYKMSVIFT